MSEFDDFDLGRRLRAAAGSDPDLDVAHQSVQRGVKRARRRRVAVLSGTAAVVIGALSLVATLDLGPDQRIQTLSPDTSSPTDGTGEVTSTTGPAESSSTSTTDAATTSTSVVTTSGPTTTAPAVGPVSTATSTTQPGASTTQPEATTSTTATTSPTSTTQVPADETNQYFSIGGSITVRLSGGQLHLVTTTLTSGYSIGQHYEKSTDIEYRFVSGDLESRIRVRLIDGQMEPDISEN